MTFPWARWEVVTDMRRLEAVFLGFILLSACGGSGSSSSGGGNSGGSTGSSTLYVRAAMGNDANGGTTPAAALQTINAAATRAKAGSTVVVGPGTYHERLIDPSSGKDGSPITYVADPGGAMTGDTPGTVVVDATGVDDPRKTGAVIRFSGRAFIVVDGFEITGSSGTSSSGISIRSKAHDITVRNCQISGNQGDAVRVSDSSDVLLFNNLLTGNGRRGAAIVGSTVGSQRVRLINNTVAMNADRGFFIGETGAASAATLRNNIIQNNVRTGIYVDAGSVGGFDSAQNLVFPATYNPSDLPHDTDLNMDADFVNEDSDDFHLDQGQSPAVDAGDSTIGDDLVQLLYERTTDPDGRPDTGDVDLGFHYTTEQPPPMGPGPAQTFYARISAGNDANDGLTPQTALASIGLAIGRAHKGDTVIVGPGNYVEGNLAPRAGTLILADPSGQSTGDMPGGVRVDARGKAAGFRLERSAGTILDGFIIVRASNYNILVRNNSDDAVVRNCEARDGFEDGITVSDSNSVTLFNNLVAFNQRRGIVIGGTATGSPSAQVVNNTVAMNADRGVYIGTGTFASPGAFLQNNIIQDNMRANIQVTVDSEVGYDARNNIVFDATYVPSDLPREFDINEDAQFLNAPMEDFHLLQSGPAIDAGDPNTNTAYQTRLAQRTTAANGTLDNDGLVDIGFHYPAP